VLVVIETHWDAFHYVKHSKHSPPASVRRKATWPLQTLRTYGNLDESKTPEILLFSPWQNSPPVGQGFLNVEASRSHSDTPHSVGLLWTNEQPDAETST